MLFWNWWECYSQVVVLRSMRTEGKVKHSLWECVCVCVLGEADCSISSYLVIYCSSNPTSLNTSCHQRLILWDSVLLWDWAQLCVCVCICMCVCMCVCRCARLPQSHLSPLDTLTRVRKRVLTVYVHVCWSLAGILLPVWGNSDHMEKNTTHT